MERIFVLCFLLLATAATADQPIRIQRICRDGQLVGIHIQTFEPIDGVIPLPAGLCNQGDA